MAVVNEVHQSSRHSHLQHIRVGVTYISTHSPGLKCYLNNMTLLSGHSCLPSLVLSLKCTLVRYDLDLKHFLLTVLSIL